MAPLARELGHESGSRRAVSCGRPSSSSSSSEQRALWVPVMGAHQPGAVLFPIPEGFGLFCPFCFLRSLHSTRCHRWVPRARRLRRLWQDSWGAGSWGFLGSETT